VTLSRRRFLGGMAPVTLAPFIPGCASDDETRLMAASSGEPEPIIEGAEPWPDPAAPASPFQHGVASGDPLADAVVLWTRITPPAGTASSVDYEWRMSLDPRLRRVVKEGSGTTDASVDYTAHVDVRGLRSGATYYYQFRAIGQASVRGRTKTLPAGAVERMRFAIASCSNYPTGYFNVYGALAQTDLDLVVHLGDYIYESDDLVFGDSTLLGRPSQPSRESISLEDYRARHAQYKTDPELQELHRQHPWVTVWDDHEVADGAFEVGAENHQPASEGEFALRKQSAVRAYREWMPMRPAADAGRVYRSFQCGDLLDLVMLDTRHRGRQVQADQCDGEELGAVDRQLLGREQESWLTEELVASRARGTRWRFIGQQVLFAPLLRSMRGCVWSPDNWDGYSASRERLLDVLDQERIDNVVVLTGDAHAAWAIDVARDPFDLGAYDPESGRGSQLVELVTPAVSSPARGAPVSQVLETHPHVKFTNQSQHGYVLIDVTHERAQAEWYFVSTVTERVVATELGAVFLTRASEPHLVAGDEPSLWRADAPSLAP
jgi:alkaline phosphatase D